MKTLTAYAGSALFLLAVFGSAHKAIAAVGPAGAPALTTSAVLPDLTVSSNPGTAPFSLLPTCAPGKNAIVFHLMVSNIGSGPSAAISNMHAVWVQAMANPAWAGGAPIPAIAAHASVAIDVTLTALAPPSAMWGHHVFRVTVNGAKTIAETSYTNNSTTIAVDISRGFCNGVSFAGNPGTGIGPTPTPTHTPYSIPMMLGPGAPATPTPLPPPINLTQAITKEVCQAHGGTAGSVACYIGLPAGKLALVWDYPFSNPVDGYRVYPDAPAPSGPIMLHVSTPITPVASQSDPTFKFVVIDPPKPGSCFAVTAYHGSQESKFSVRFCIGSGGLAKIVSLNPDIVGSAIHDTFYNPHVEVWKQNGTPPVINDTLSLDVGFTHVADTWRDNAHTDVAQYDNSLFRGYVHFNTSSMAGHHIAQAQLHLQAGTTQGTSGGQTCLVYWGGADHVWSAGNDVRRISEFGNGRIQGPDIRLDVTTIVQGWADSPSSNYGIALDSDQSQSITAMLTLSSTCLTTFTSAALDVTYY